MKGDTLSASNPPTPRKPVEAVKGNPLDAEQEEDQYSNHYIKSEECLDFLIAGFDELLRCRNVIILAQRILLYFMIFYETFLVVAMVLSVRIF